MNRLPIGKQIAVIGALTEGCSIRSTERLTGVHRDTIMRLGARIGHGCAKVHDELMFNLRPPVIQLDELWAFIGKKQKRVTAQDDPEKGDSYTFLALDSFSKTIITYRVGKRTRETTLEFIEDLGSRVLGIPQISSDSFFGYEDAIRTVFGGQVHYGQVVKRFVGEPHPKAVRRYSPGTVTGINKNSLIGFPPRFLISTSHVERLNLSVRMAQRRFTRLTSGYSKRADNHAAAVSLFVAHYNFCRVHEAIRVTPAMEIGVTDHIWSIEELIEAATSGPKVPAGRQIGRFRIIDGGKS